MTDPSQYITDKCYGVTPCDGLLAVNCNVNKADCIPTDPAFEKRGFYFNPVISIWFGSGTALYLLHVSPAIEDSTGTRIRRTECYHVVRPLKKGTSYNIADQILYTNFNAKTPCDMSQCKGNMTALFFPYKG